MIKRAEPPRLIAESVYWLGSAENPDSLETNTYLIYRNGKGIIIDPGPRAVFRETLAAVREITAMEEITSLVVSDQAPDVCSSLPSWEEEGFTGRIVSHRKTEFLLKSYGLLSHISSVKEGPTDWEESDGLIFLPLSYRTSPGLLLTYDPQSGTLFSSRLFNSTGDSRGLYANESYLAGMTAFRNEFFSSDEEVNGTLREFGKLDIKRICPLHGCIVDRDTDSYLSALAGSPLEPAMDGSNGAGGMNRDDWEKESFDLNEELVLSIDEKMLDPITGLYSASFFKNFLPDFIKLNPEGAVAFFRIDDMKTFNNTYGFHEGDRAIATFASFIQRHKPDDSYLFRESGPILILMLPDSNGEEHIRTLEHLQNLLRESKDFIQDITCSIAAARIAEVQGEGFPDEALIRHIRHRLQYLDFQGNHSLCISSEEEEERGKEKIILIIDSDPVTPRLLHDFFIHRGYVVHACRDGGEALHQIDLYRPHIIISELMVPQMDGFRIRERMLQSRDLRNIPFLFLSHRKTEDSVIRAHKLGVFHNLKKPVILAELLGLVRVLVKDDMKDD